MKYCMKCETSKDLTSFGKRAASSDGLQSYCKECNKAYQQKHYSSNSATYKAKSKDSLVKNRQWLFEYKTGKPCIDCKLTYHPVVMDFDHVRGEKLFEIADGMSKARSKLLEEIAKCELVCSNCHRMRTYTRKQE